jgi:ADP-ribose pyrophosphatase YjhB (NUDIX family)
MKNKELVLCVDGLCVKKGKILLVKRNVEPFKGSWHLVGGHVEKDETLKEALKREFREETKLDVKIGDFIDIRIEETFDRLKIIVTFKVIAARGKVCLDSENITYNWFNEIPRDFVYDYFKLLLNKGPSKIRFHEKA